MENLRYLLTAIAALTLIMSIVSSVNPSYFAGMNAFADHDEEDDDNSGSSNDDHGDDENESEEDDNKGKEKDDEEKMVKSLGNHSKAALEVEDDAELQVEIEDGDLGDGTYDVVFACTTPDVDEEFASALEVEDGEGEFEQDLPLTNGTYTGCEVEVGGLSATFESFTIMATDDHDDEEDESEEDDNKGKAEREHERELKKESKLRAGEDGIQIELEVEGLNMTDGSYDAIFACDAPSFNVTLGDAFEVEDGEGELEEMIGLANSTYTGCEITVEGTVLASFRPFTVSEESDDEQKQRVEEKRKEKTERIITTINGTTIHEKHRSDNARSPGEYEPGWNYTLAANGTAMHNVHNGTADHDSDATVDINMAVWKSNTALILLDVIDGTVEVENQTYTVVLGYGLYVMNHDSFRVAALAVDDDGNIFRLKLSGNAIGEEVKFPMESGSIELTFEGSRGPPDRLGDWELAMDGTITAG